MKLETDHTAQNSRAFCEVRSLTEELAAPLSCEDQTVQSMPDASPTKWHRAHTTWFFEEFLLSSHGTGYRRFNESYRFLFNSYYEAVGPRHARPERGMLSRPGVEEIGAYRNAVDHGVLDLIDGGLPNDAADVLELGLHHEQQHQELLLMDIKHALSKNPLRPQYRPLVAATDQRSAGDLSWSEHEGGVVEIGAAGSGFAFDNEMPRHNVYVQPFAIANRTVTCRDWLSFIDDGGYERAELWLSDGWASVQSHEWRAPLYWRAESGQFLQFTLGGERPLVLDEPVCHISYYEADA